MPLRKQIIATGETYHVVNRGVNSAPIFHTYRDYLRFLSLTDFYRFNNKDMSFSNYLKLEKNRRNKYFTELKNKHDERMIIHSFCLMSNHFHFLVTQSVDDGIRNAFSNIQNAYVKYFNLRHKRFGPMFQSRFRALRIEGEQTFLHVSRYIHLNPVTGYLVKKEQISSYEWSSYPEFVKERNLRFTRTDDILALAGSVEKYKNFVLDQADYQREINKIRHLLLDN